MSCTFLGHFVSVGNICRHISPPGFRPEDLHNEIRRSIALSGKDLRIQDFSLEALAASTIKAPFALPDGLHKALAVVDAEDFTSLFHQDISSRARIDRHRSMWWRR